ncbi:CoA transferase [Methylonatrum kenyense]|uniref:CaiB/BaiF CoA transferase family protein n=1 Tax=Methylonatrum kenyense TaxID=455253 RepID=UPI0020BDC383|nr:CoA transferase [Methylonatrum kenyense]MCK8514944.1 CoA transferase [Methylonatrum kenyense]
MKALHGIRVLDLTHMLSGPYGAMLLADMGADTIKVEPPAAGEGTRKLLAKNERFSLKGMGAYFLTLNRNKRSVCLDLKSERGLELFYGLVEEADVVIDNFSAGVTSRLKIDHEHLSKINPRIVTCSVTGFGSAGPDPMRPAFDQVIQGMGGGMSITGEPGGRPLRAGIPIGDLSGGMFAAMGILSALVARQSTGRGQHVDISMLDCQISMLNYMATMYSLSGENPEPLGNGHFVHVPYNTFDTATQPIIIAVIFDTFWENLAEIVDVPEFKDEKYLTQPGRFEDREFINSRLQEVLLTRPADEWIALLREKRIPVAPVNNFEQALNDPQVRFRNMVVEVEHPDGGSTEMPGNPVKLSETYEDSFSSPPLLGQHTSQVLQDLLGLDEAQLDELRTHAIIR